MTDDKITVGVVSVEDADTGLDSIGQAETDERNTPYAIVLPVGLSVGVPSGSNVLLLSVNGDAGNRVGVPFQSENRFRGLKQYEVKLGNLKKKTNVFFDDEKIDNIFKITKLENKKKIHIFYYYLGNINFIIIFFFFLNPKKKKPKKKKKKKK